ncbi:MAG TPA: glycosyltransferase, partial [Caulobacteraceae bacterium]
ARAAHASLVYHEHDAPGPGHHVLHRLRRAAARSARLIVFPNLERARIAQAELGFADQRLRILWNLPRLAELPTLPPRSGEPLILYFHGSISPDRVPRAVVKAIRRLEGAVRLQIVGYQAPGAPGYVDELVELGRGSDGFSLVEYLGIVPKRTEMLAVAARAHIGLAVMPLTSSDLNMRHMTGASNKAFDYMAAGLALLVSDLDDWRAMFVEPGFARACDPEDPDSIAAALLWFLQHDRDRQTMAARARAKIKTEWHYDKMFAPVADALAHISKPPTPRTVP